MPLGWAALSAGVLQTVLEVRLDAQAREGTRSRLGAGRRLLRMRDDWQYYDRFLRAGGVQAGRAMNESRARRAQDIHDMFIQVRSRMPEAAGGPGSSHITVRS
ncbi:hypothetical protein [Streptomyces sp. NRRL S-37]|uniref:hypothetical protein n=1 Tax=Streptomyces sp. NRRL S-37 TaxID=1463903 RepID=UPI0004C51DDE|nr:hypothetical protein [Streptomyces sp. NRRL S-37]